MKNLKMGNKVMALLLAIAMMFGLVACGESDTNSGDAKAESSSTNETATEATEETVHLTWLVGTGVKDMQDTEVAKEIEKQIGITFEFVEADDEKYQVLLAGGDLPDIIRTDPTKYGNQLTVGELILPLEELVSSDGQAITEMIPGTLDILRRDYGGDEETLYYIPVQVANEPKTMYRVDIGATVRWDYYQEIGTPEINTPDDLLNALAQMQENHPTTEDGNKVYGMTFWNDWGNGLWSYRLAGFPWGSDKRGVVNMVCSDFDDITPKNVYVDEESAFSVGVKMFYKANQMGILDPDALTMKYDDVRAKSTAGQVLWAPANFATTDFNAENSNDGAGFTTIPVGDYAWTGEVTPKGWVGSKLHAISSSCEYPEKAMELLNYTYTYEGGRLMHSGIEGVHWDYVDGVPTLKEETLALQSDGGENWDATGINFDGNIMGLNDSVICADGYPTSLFNVPEVYAARLTNLEKDYCDYYGVDYPGQAFENAVADGSMMDMSYLGTDETFALDSIRGIELPDDMKRIQAKIEEIAVKYAAKMVLAESDEEFEAYRQEMLAEFEEAGEPEFTAWCVNELNIRYEEVGLK